MSSDNTEKVFGLLNYVARKSAHVGEYALLCYLWFRSLWTSRKRLRTVLRWSVGLSVLYAVTDEVHQGLIPQRDGAWTDVVWDTMGALVMGVSLLWIGIRGRGSLRNRILGIAPNGDAEVK